MDSQANDAARMRRGFRFSNELLFMAFEEVPESQAYQKLLRAGPTSPSRSSSATASGLPDAVRTTTGGDCDGDLPVPRWKASAHARVCDDAGPARISRSRHGPSRLLLDENISAPNLSYAAQNLAYALPYQRCRSRPSPSCRGCVPSSNTWS